MIAGRPKSGLQWPCSALRSMPQEPLISLCIGVTLLRMVMQKLTANRHKVSSWRALNLSRCTSVDGHIERLGAHLRF